MARHMASDQPGLLLLLLLATLSCWPVHGERIRTNSLRAAGNTSTQQSGRPRGWGGSPSGTVLQRNYQAAAPAAAAAANPSASFAAPGLANVLKRHLTLPTQWLGSTKQPIQLHSDQSLRVMVAPNKQPWYHWLPPYHHPTNRKLLSRKLLQKVLTGVVHDPDLSKTGEECYMYRVELGVTLEGISTATGIPVNKLKDDQPAGQDFSRLYGKLIRMCNIQSFDSLLGPEGGRPKPYGAPLSASNSALRLQRVYVTAATNTTTSSSSGGISSSSSSRGGSSSSSSSSSIPVAGSSKSNGTIAAG